MKNLLISLMICAGTFVLSGCGDACDDILCKNGGTAVPDGDKCSCNCAPGYEGEYCEIQTRQKILGTFNASAICDHPVRVDRQFTIKPSGTYEDRVHLGLYYSNSNCDTVSFASTPYATVNKNKLTIPPQPYTLYGKEYILSGSGTISAGVSGIIIDLDINPTPADSCFKACSLVLTKVE
jgi:hypothetical protein